MDKLQAIGDTQLRKLAKALYFQDANFKAYVDGNELDLEVVEGFLPAPVQQQGVSRDVARVLIQMAQDQMDPWGHAETRRTVDESKEICDAALKHYGVAKKFCMVQGNTGKHTINLHIWPESAATEMALHGLLPEQVHNPKNIIRAHHDFERMWDAKRVTLDWTYEFKVVVLDPTLKHVLLKDTQITFGALHGRSVPFSKPPWRRLIAAHSIQAHKLAAVKRWVEPQLASDAKLRAFELARFSLDDEAQDRLRLFCGEPRLQPQP